MSKDYDVAVRWHIGSAASETTTVHVEAATTAQALKLARRGIYLDHPGAAIDKTEIVCLEKSREPLPESMPTAAEIRSNLEADRTALLTDPKIRIGAAVVTDFVAERPERAAAVAAAAPDPVAVEVPVAVFARSSTLVAEIAKRFGEPAVGAFLDAMDEFMGSRRSNAWTGSRLWITVAKVPELKRKAA